MIVLDTREHDLIRLLSSASPTVKQLSVGDAYICNQEETPLVIVERKAVADLEASLLDGRYREQRTRLLAYCAQTGARPMYIIEGELDRLNGRMTKQALQKVLNRLMLRYGIPVWRTDSLEDTAKSLQLLEEQCVEDPTVFVAQTLSYTDVTQVTKKANKENPTVFAMMALQGCPGVSASIAKVILEKFGSFTALLAATEEDIASLKNGTRKIGPAVAKRLHGLLHATSVTM
jgi:ERCC4-type nuclease